MKFKDLVLLAEDNEDIKVKREYWDKAKKKLRYEYWYNPELNQYGDETFIYHHRLDGPAVQTWYKNGQKNTETWIKDGIYHRLDGPGYQHWYENGQKRYESWRKDGKYHRLDGPAIQMWDENGQKESEVWYKDGDYHRTDGPAIQEWDENGNKTEERYFINDKELTPNEFKQLHKQYNKEDMDILNDLNT